jgi:hypothetical protein
MDPQLADWSGVTTRKLGAYGEAKWDKNATLKFPKRDAAALSALAPQQGPLQEVNSKQNGPLQEKFHRTDSNLVRNISDKLQMNGMNFFPRGAK